MWFTVHYGATTPSLRHNFSDVDCAAKLLDTMTMLSHMTGDTDNQEMYRGYMKGVFNYVEDDRHFWVCRLEEDRPWAVVYGFDPENFDAKESDEDVARAAMTAKMEQTCLSLYQASGDADWLKLAEEIQQAVNELTIRKEDYAYIPVNGGTTLPCGLRRSRKGWFEAAEAAGAVEGHEHSGMVLTGLTGDEAIEICFDVPAYSASYTTNARTPFEKKYTIDFRGSNAVNISPRSESPTHYSFFTDENLRTAISVPRKEVSRFIPDRELKIW